MTESQSDRGGSDPGLYPVILTGGGASRVLDDAGEREVGISVPGLIGGVVDTGPDLRFKGGIFLTIMSVVTQHLVWFGMQRSRAWCGTPPILGVVNMVGTRNFTCYMGAL